MNQSWFESSAPAEKELIARCELALFGLMAVSTFGASKHGRYSGWAGIDGYDVKMEGAVLRHRAAWPEQDDSQLIHAFSTFANAAMLNQFIYHRPISLQRFNDPAVAVFDGLPGSTDKPWMERWSLLANDWQETSVFPYPIKQVQTHYTETLAEMALCYQDQKDMIGSDYKQTLAQADHITSVICNEGSSKDLFIQRALLYACAVHDYMAPNPDDFVKVYQAKKAKALAA